MFRKRRKPEDLEPPLPLKVVGWGPFPLPGEKKRQARAYAKARRLMGLAETIDSRSAKE